MIPDMMFTESLVMAMAAVMLIVLAIAMYDRAPIPMFGDHRKFYSL